MPPVIESPLGAVLTALERLAGNASPTDVLADFRVVRGRLDVLEAEATARVARQHDAVTEVHMIVQGISQSEARRRERRAATLATATESAAALGRGAVVAEHADILASTLGRFGESERAALLEHESALLDRAVESSPEAFARHCRAVVAAIADDRGVSDDARQRRETRLSRRVDHATGMHHLAGQFHPELGSRIFEAIDGQIATLRADGSVDDGVQPERLAAEALGSLVAPNDPCARGSRGEILVTIDYDTLRSQLHDRGVCETSTGVSLAPESVRRLCCDHHIVPVVLGGDGIVLDLGRTRRLASSAQRAALRGMCATCAFPGCRTPFSRCRMHHVDDWLSGGPTDLANLIPLCERHHRLVHEGGFSVEIDAQRTITIREPDGAPFAVAPLRDDQDSATGRARRTGVPPPEDDSLGDDSARAGPVSLFAYVA